MKYLVSRQQWPLAMATAMILVAGSAAAQGVDSAALALAQKQVEDANSDMERKDFAAACPKLEKATKLIPRGVGGHLLLGACYEAVERLGSAWYEYNAARLYAEESGDAERASKATAKLDAIQPKVATLTIAVSDELQRLPGLTVKRDENIIHETRWNLAAPVDAGDLRIEVTAPGYEPWREVAKIRDNGAATELRVPMLVPIKAAPGRKTVDGDSGRNREPMKTVGFVGIGVGVTSALFGAVLGGWASQQYRLSNADNHCDTQNRCDKQGLALRDEANRLAVGADISFVAGGVFVLGGFAALFLPPIVAKKGSSAETTVGFGVSGQGIKVWGTF